MILFLSQYINQLFNIHILEYVSFRALLACMFSAVVSVSLGGIMIRILSRLKVQQIIRHDGPQTHLQKSGTPTMGGILIVITTSITSLLFTRLSNPYIWTVLFVLISTSCIGFIDDYSKISRKNSKGISGKYKLLLQLLVAIIVVYVLLHYIHLPHTSYLIIPLLKSMHCPYHSICFICIALFVIIGSSNAINLTDGLDGLVSLPIVTTTIGLGIFAYIAGNKLFAHYFLLPSIPGTQEIVVFCGGLIGSCLGFLWFNAYPAKILMGDVGALSIGATLGTIAVILRQEISFAIIGSIFVIETLSVILQVMSYKIYKKRVFRMAPIHHHFELRGWSETQVVVRFWIISIITLLLGLSTIKLR